VLKKNKIKITDSVRDKDTIKSKIVDFMNIVKSNTELVIGFNIIRNNNILNSIHNDLSEYLYKKDLKYDVIINIDGKPATPILKIKLPIDDKKTNLPKMVNIIKLKTDTFGNEEIIENEKREPLIKK
jgi:hypothetical protein